MASLTIRKLDDAIRDELRLRAARNGRSVEDEVRVILRDAAQQQRPTVAATTPETVPQGLQALLRSRAIRACSAPAASAGGSSVHTSAISVSGATGRFACVASAVSTARTFAPPSGRTVPSCDLASVTPSTK